MEIHLSHSTVVSEQFTYFRVGLKLLFFRVDELLLVLKVEFGLCEGSKEGSPAILGEGPRLLALVEIFDLILNFLNLFV